MTDEKAFIDHATHIMGDAHCRLRNIGEMARQMSELGDPHPHVGAINADVDFLIDQFTKLTGAWVGAESAQRSLIVERDKWFNEVSRLKARG